MKKGLTTEIVAGSPSDSDVSDNDIELDDVELDKAEWVDEDVVPRQKIEVDDKVYY